MKISRAFKLTAEKMQRSDPNTLRCDNFICLSIQFNPVIPDEVKTVCKSIIRQRLGDSPTYCTWLKKNHKELWDIGDVDFNYFNIKCHEARIAWLHSLGEEFEAKGE